MLINAVIGGIPIEKTVGEFIDFAPVRYLTPLETRTISEALLQISQDEFEHRYQEACKYNPNVYRTIRDGEFECYWYRLQCISEYYTVAVKRERGMLLYLGCFYGADFEWKDVPVE